MARRYSKRIYRPTIIMKDREYVEGSPETQQTAMQRFNMEREQVDQQEKTRQEQYLVVWKTGNSVS